LERKTILVVEDNKDELMIYSTLLSFRGYSILAATGYNDALQIAIEQQPDLAIVDVNLNDPDRDGCDLIRALHEHERTEEMPIIGHTAFGDVYRESLEDVGCDAIIHKPTSPAVLLEAIERIIGPGREIDDE
jgi:two-component system cell cycle response regulator DivK